MSLAWGGYANGNIPLSKMSVVPDVQFSPLTSTVTAARGANRLQPEAARQMGGLAREFKAHFGVTLVLSEAYRPLVRQQETWDIYQHGGNPAAFPGTSNHGWGRSVDLANGIGTWTSATHIWMIAAGKRYGWFFTVSNEGWHMDYLGGASSIVPASYKPPVVIKPTPVPIEKVLEQMSSIGYVQTLNASSKNAGGKPRGAGVIPKGWIFAIDIQNKTIERVTYDKQIGLGTTLNPGGKLLGMAADTAWSYADHGYKRIGW